MSNSKPLLVSLIFVFAILGVYFFGAGCDTPVIPKPPAIQIDTVDGQVLNKSVGDTILITGRVIKGTNAIQSFYAVSESDAKLADITLNPDFTFEYLHVVTGDSDPLTIDFNQCLLKVVDTQYVSNRQRITFIRVDVPNQIGVPEQSVTVNRALNVLLNENLINTMSDAAVSLINENIQPILDGAGIFPFTVIDLNVNILGIIIDIVQLDITSAEITDVSMGHIDITDIPGQEIQANDAKVGSLVINGECILGTLAPYPFRIAVENVDLSQVRLGAYINENTNDINVKFDVDSLDSNFWNQLNIDTSFAGWDPPDIVLNLMVEVLGKFFTWFFNEISIPILDVNDLSGEVDVGVIADALGLVVPDLVIGTSIWFLDDVLYETNSSEEMSINLGLELKPVTENAANPGLDHFYSTPGDLLPDYSDLALNQGEHHNLSVGINDDMINMALFSAIQGGLLNGLNITEMFGPQAESFVKIPEILVHLNAPPIADWTDVDGEYISDDGISCYAGKYIVRNLMIEIKDVAVPKNDIRISVDVELALNLVLSEDGTHIKASMDRSRSTFKFNYLYVNILDLTALGQFAEDMVVYVMDLLMRSMLQIDVPESLGDGTGLRPYLYKADIIDNHNMVVWLGLAPLEGPLE